MQLVSDGKPATVSSLQTDFHVCQKPCPATFQVTAPLIFVEAFRYYLWHLLTLSNMSGDCYRGPRLIHCSGESQKLDFLSLQMTEFRFFAHRRLIVLPPAHLYHFYEAKIKFRVMNLGKVWMIIIIFHLDRSVESGRSKHQHCEQNSLQVRMAAVPRLGEKLSPTLYRL